MEFQKKIYRIFSNVFIKRIKREQEEKAERVLGLAIAKNIIDSHGGTITATRGELKGTIFSCTLPLKNM